jgi:hypothetical protein
MSKIYLLYLVELAYRIYSVFEDGIALFVADIVNLTDFLLSCRVGELRNSLCVVMVLLRRINSAVVSYA